ncbi:PREDICTED: uncharacterized protein LOC106115502 [Papilio xuthus]|uniref:Uncharacterized protein LOC106115502 n=1 Tax=Papilio xuthus TaxID=66420 RepID=A0AAJ7E5Y7_PAPXU|nr:PREDICTED: uncharacterized protein LOC106115502 [Papilio xuthus]
MAKIFESIKDSTETNKNEPVANKLIDDPDIEFTGHKNFDDLESPDLESPIDCESPSFDKIEFFNNDLDISQSMLDPKSLLESLAQNDIILPPLQFRDEPKRDSTIFDTINLDDPFEKDDNTSSTASEIETWTMSNDDETWSNICKSATAEQNIPSTPTCYLQTTPSRKLKLNQFKYSRKKIFEVQK